MVSVSGGLEGKLKPYWEYSFGDTDYFRLTASLNAYAKAELLCFSYKKDWDPIAEAIWLEYPARKNTQTATQGNVEFTPYDTSAYTVSDLSYLDEPSQFLPAQRNTRAVSSEDIVVTDYITNVYANAEPQIAAFSDGTMLAVWIDGTSDVNSLQLCYSYFDGTDWAQPSMVEADGTMDGAPYLTVLDDAAYLVWQDASAAIDETATLDELAPLMSISFASFDKDSKQFSVQNVTENVESLNMMPTVCASEDEISVVWLNNAENAWFGDNSANAILCRSFNGKWGEVQTLYSGLQSVDSLTAAYIDGALSVAYCVDTDGDIATETDVEAFLNGEKISENEVLDSGITYSNGVLYRYQNGTIVDENGNEIAKLETDRFQVIDENGVKAIVYNQYNGLYSAIYAVFYDAESKAWGEPIALTSSDASYKSFSACVDTSGTLSIFANCIAVSGDYLSEDPYGEATLQLITVSLACDLAITDSYYDCSTYVAGADMTFDISVKNNGEVAASGMLVQIKNENSNILGESLFMDAVLPGASTEITCGFTPDSIEPGKTLTISVMPFNQEDRNEADNSTTAVLSFEDVTVENIGWGINMADEAVIYADIVNRSYTQHNVPVTVHLRDGEENIQTVTIDSMEAMESVRVSFSEVYEEGKVYYIVLETDEQNSNLANDSDFIVLANEDSEEPEPIYDGDLQFGHSLTLENDISINFIGRGEQLSAYDTFYLECKVPVYDGNELVVYETVNVDPVFNGTNYEFTLTGITAKMMNDEIEAVFRLTKDGQEYYSKTDVYSVAEYAYGKLNSTKAADTDALKAVCANLIRYGAYAQAEFGYRTDALVTDAFTAEHRGYLTLFSAVEMADYRKQLSDHDAPTVPWKSTTLELGNKVIMCLIVNLANYTGDVSELTMRLTYTDSKGETVTVDRPLELYNADAKTYTDI